MLGPTPRIILSQAKCKRTATTRCLPQCRAGAENILSSHRAALERVCRTSQTLDAQVLELGVHMALFNEF